MELEIKLNGASASFIINADVDKAKCNCYKSSATNKRKDIVMIKNGLSKANLEDKVKAHKEMFTKLITEWSNNPLAGLFPEGCYPIKVTDARTGMILEGDDKMWVEIDAEGNLVD